MGDQDWGFGLGFPIGDLGLGLENENWDCCLGELGIMIGDSGLEIRIVNLGME